MQHAVTCIACPTCLVYKMSCILWRSSRSWSSLVNARSAVQDACSSPDDLLPGLCALAERWLGDVALPGFRGAPPQIGTLTDWFDDRRVSLYLQV